MEQARKDDTGKPRLDLVPAEMMDAMGRAFGHGAEKYNPWNWLRGPGLQASRLHGALLRHLNAWASGEDTDPESGLLHLDHAAASLAMLIGTLKEHPLNDDRAHIALSAWKYPLSPGDQVMALDNKFSKMPLEPEQREREPLLLHEEDMSQRALRVFDEDPWLFVDDHAIGIDGRVRLVVIGLCDRRFRKVMKRYGVSGMTRTKFDDLRIRIGQHGSLVLSPRHQFFLMYGDHPGENL